MRVLNVGCGQKKRDFPEAGRADDIVGIDFSPKADADVCHDLDVIPWPIEENGFDLIIMQDVIEHLEDVPAVMRELHRVARHGCVVRIRTPHYSSTYAYNDPTHKHYFGAYAFDGFVADGKDDMYADAWFRMRKRVIIFPKVWRITGIARLVNRSPHRWEQLFAFIFRAENLYFELEAIKK